MKKKLRLRLISVTLCLALVFIGFSGCSKSDGETDIASEAKYYEVATGLPDGMLTDAGTVNGQAAAVMITESGYNYFVKTDTGWSSTPIEAVLALEEQSHYAYDAYITPEGGVYILCAESDETLSLWYSKDLKTSTLVASNDELCQIDGEAPGLFTALGNGLIAGIYWQTQSIIVFEVNGGEAHIINGAGSISRCGDYLIVCNAYEPNMRQIDPNTWTQTDVSTDFVSLSVCDNVKSGILVASQSGMYSGAVDGTMWLELFGFKGMSFGQSDATIEKIFTVGDTIYIKYFDGSYIPQLSCVVYGIPEKIDGGEVFGTLRVWSMVEEAAVNETILQLKKAYPALTIEYTTAFPTDNYKTSVPPDDAIRALNASLLAGDGPDVIITDYLNADFYIKSGLLSDMSGFVDEMVNDGVLMGNVVNGARKGDELYAFPTSFGIPATVGDPALCEYSSLNDLVEKYTASETTKKLMGGSDSVAEPIGYFLPLYYNQIVDNGRVNEAALRDFLEGIKTIGELCDWNPENESVGWIFSGKSEISRLRFDYGAMMSHSNIIELMLKNSAAAPIEIDKTALASIAFNEQKCGAELKPIGNLYVPHSSIAITSCASNYDAAVAFVKAMVSEDVASAMLVDGFTVNREALKKELAEQYAYGEATSEINIEDTVYECQQMTEEDCDCLLKMAEDLKSPIDVDLLLLNVFVDGSTDYLNGNQSLDDCVKSLTGTLNTYLAEN